MVAEAGVLGLTALAIGATVAGFAALIGTPGLALGALLMVLIGNPFSGAASAPELLPEAVGLTGPGAAAGSGGKPAPVGGVLRRERRRGAGAHPVDLGRARAGRGADRGQTRRPPGAAATEPRTSAPASVG
jgi:hypothetical protein